VATPYPPHEISCSSVARVDIAFGDGADSLFVDAFQDPKVPVRISGGDGDDDLYVAIPPGDVTVDGGPGNDTITTGSATVLGGPGDDAIAFSWTPEDHTSPVIDCGPGNDHFADGAALPASVRATVEAATCPPILRALGRFRRAENGFFTAPTFKVPANRRLRVALFRAAEPVSGTVRFHESRSKSSCGKPVRFHAAAGQQVRVTLAVLPSVLRRLDRGRQVGCAVTVTGTDDEGEPISGGTPYAYLLLAPGTHKE
jgi:Ca2+-binding RTX toxin-like protein